MTTATHASGTTLTTFVWNPPCGGKLLLGSYGKQLVVCDWVEGWHHARIMARLAKFLKADVVEGRSRAINQALAWLESYFKGSRSAPKLDLLFLGTDYQKRVWKALCGIPYGKTVTYGDIARAAGSPAGSRAAGVAVGENPFSIIVPCHRVVGKNGSITGYGGGYDVKKYLLALELGVDIESLPFKDIRSAHRP